ncbi:hypothetical protein FOA43_003604 [Brettanomyces nanus]|uniref:Amidase domain-containing protein n=1 Tax=Eeniella nana TaxID=13502 RepID=A0A875S5H7_EENNA|nr:uncharacterized protein FOA43_003604 [Brettanomyces nanus]QPG76218.1 hypothetical protein FOA43_003604 [Brettanomyces nanus]
MTWIEVKKSKLEVQKQLIKEYLAPHNQLPSVDDLNDVTGYLDRCALMTSREKQITNYSISELQYRYLAKELTAEEVVRAFCHRSTLAHQLVNCITEVRFKESLEEARKQDAFVEEQQRLVGPLHGVIISVKDNINVSGLATSLGLVGLAEKEAVQDSAVVTLLKKLGGIIICKTNVPSGLMFAETSNMLWGRTLNPFNRKYLNVGGSSGGEGAMASLKGSCFGIGSDIGGSVRHPAALNNVYCIKPSFGRFPCYGTESGQPGQESIRTVYGIISSKIENVEYSLRVCIDAKPYLDIDASCLPLPYSSYDINYKVPLNIAFMESDGLTTVTPPVQRGLYIVKEALKAEGHNVIDWPCEYFDDIRKTIYPFYDANGLKTIKDILEKSEEPVDPHIHLDNCRDMPVSELWALQHTRTALVQKYLHYWNTGYEGGRLDAIIIPTSAFPACLMDKVPPQPYTSVWNVVDYSASTFPVTRCDTDIDKPMKKNHFISDTDRQVHEIYSKELQKFEGGPVGLQLVCNRLEEEKCLALTRYVSSLLEN